MTLIFFALAIIAAIFGYGGMPGLGDTAAFYAQCAFAALLVLFIGSCIRDLASKPRSF